jgi:hypothetical protein
MWLLDQIAEHRIQEAVDRGELQGLPGEGRPLAEEDDALVPETLRVGYRLLKNAGYVPEEVQLRREIADAESLLRIARTEEERSNLQGRIQYLLQRLNRDRRGALLTQEAYWPRIQSRLSGEDA